MSRKIAREKAMQVLFQIELTNVDPEEAMKNVLEESELDEKSKAFSRMLIQGTLEKLDQVDEKIKESAHKWQLERIGNVEKTVLRMGAYEILYLEEIPNAVAINEAITLVKVYSTEKAAPFVNGILDKIANGKSN